MQLNDPDILVDVLVRALSHQGLEREQGAPPCTFRHTPKRNGADCPAGGSTLIATGLGPWWDAMRIWSGSGAQNSPGTVDKVTASTHSIQIGIPSPRVTPASRSPDPVARHVEQPNATSDGP